LNDKVALDNSNQIGEGPLEAWTHSQAPLSNERDDRP